MPASCSQVLLIRADAHTSIGAGHVFRCLALAQRWMACGGKAHLAMAMDAGPLEKRLVGAGLVVHKLAAVANSRDDYLLTAELASQLQAKWVVLDGYHLTASFQQYLKDAGQKLIVIDDNSEHDHYFADIILNPNIYARHDFYPSSKIEPYTLLLLGREYTLLRQEFFSYCNYHRLPIRKGEKHLLVLMGSGDPDNVTALVLKALGVLQRPDVHCRVVIGANNPHRVELEELVDTSAGKIEFLFNVQDMPKLYRWADCAVTATGGTCYELNFMQLPFLSIVVADNQVNLAAMVMEIGGRSLGWHQSLTPHKIAQELGTLLDRNDDPIVPEIRITDFVQRLLMEELYDQRLC